MYMLWFKFSFGTIFLKPVQFLYSFVIYSLPLCGIMANKIETSSKNIKPRLNLNHNIYISYLQEVSVCSSQPNNKFKHQNLRIVAKHLHCTQYRYTCK